MAAEPKRIRSGEDASAADAAPVSRSELEDLLAEARSAIATESTSIVQKMERSITENFTTVIRSVDSANQKRFGGIETELQALRQRMDDSENANQAMRAQLGEMSKALAVAEQPQPTRKDLTADDWDKEPDHSILRINFAQGKHGTRVLIERAIKPWLEESNIKPGQWELIGPASSQNFSIKFVGTQGLGARRARSAFTNLKDDAGAYRKMVAEDLARQEVAMFIDENKNQKQRKGETDARRMAKIMRAALPDRNVAVIKRDFQVKIDFVPIVKFEPVRGEESKIRWNNKGLADLGLTDQRAAYVERFSAPRPATAEWDG